MQSPPNIFMQRYYYLLRFMGVFSQKATVGVQSEAIFRSIEEQATQNTWFDGTPNAASRYALFCSGTRGLR